MAAFFELRLTAITDRTKIKEKKKEKKKTKTTTLGLAVLSN